MCFEREVSGSGFDFALKMLGEVLGTSIGRSKASRQKYALGQDKTEETEWGEYKAYVEELLRDEEIQRGTSEQEQEPSEYQSCALTLGLDRAPQIEQEKNTLDGTHDAVDTRDVTLQVEKRIGCD